MMYAYPYFRVNRFEILIISVEIRGTKKSTADVALEDCESWIRMPRIDSLREIFDRCSRVCQIAVVALFSYRFTAIT